ncbi:hypothetical protein ARMGADRAFT_1029436 [Armillaria gallica]|uniref:Uncharacterized protein n=1 Tax=Armillaria gallica TaxID=47427 RepID=A0A2H3DGE6_ARMGA|nr:hypothetical protein ARMGADRAFT_1029436 [Armillaria gallica]
MATGLGVHIQVHGAMTEYVLELARYRTLCFGRYRVPAFPSHIYNTTDSAVWRADGASLALYTGCTGFLINDLHPVFLLTLLPLLGEDPLQHLADLTGPILQSLDRSLCDSICAWFYLAPTDPIGSTLGDPVPQALISLHTQFQVHQVGLRHSRSAEEHRVQTQDLLMELVMGNTTFWCTEAFRQMRMGFHQPFNELLPTVTIPRVHNSQFHFT